MEKGRGDDLKFHCIIEKAAARLGFQGTLQSVSVSVHPSLGHQLTPHRYGHPTPPCLTTARLARAAGFVMPQSSALPLQPTNFVTVNAHKENTDKQRNKASALPGGARFVQFLLIS